MENIPPTIYIAVGAIVAALISGFLSFINLTISKDHKVSEFRQDWINSLREEVSNLIGLLTKMKTSLLFTDAQNGNTKERTFVQNNLDTIEKIEALASKITLRLNPIEHVSYIKLIEELDGIISCPEELLNSDKVENFHKKLVVDTQEILRDEWLIVKTGEASYIKIKRNITIGFKVCLLLLVLVAIVA